MPENKLFRNALTQGDCPSLDDLQAFLDRRADIIPILAQHLEQCAHCRTELSLLREFQEGASPAEREQVDWIAQRLRKNAPHRRRKSFWFGLRPQTWAAVATGLVLAVTAGTYVRNSSRLSVQVAGEPDVMRSGSIEGLAPVGDVATAPRDMRWNLAPAAVSFQVRLMEVDRNVIWSGTTSTNSILWEVSGIDSGGKPLSVSPTERIRVKPRSDGKP